ncbi:MAG TPA: ATP-dependent DNA ligase [candidate division Zixibacteria bacterium]|nr:ATP-dependent DNA ligase [candidate division Zixibacteria bacterium]
MTSTPFAEFARTADAVATTRSKLAKRDLLAAYLRGLPEEDLPVAATYFAGRPLPGADDRLGLGWVQQSQALAAASGADAAALNAAYLRHSDFGDAAADLLKGRRPSGRPLTVADVDAAFRAMSTAPSAEERVAILARLFGRATAAEARYIGRIASRELRIGLREGLLEEAIAAAFERPIADVRRALMLVGEAEETAVLARADALGSAALHLGRPVRFMLATPVADAAEVMRRVGDEAWIEDKYDGIRAQLHMDPAAKLAPRLFSRDLKDITISFPDVVEAVRLIDHALVVDGELVPYRAGSVLDFASLQTRLGRVNPSAQLLEEVPVVLVAFDLLHLDGRDLLEVPLRERRAALEALELPRRTGERILYSHLATARSAEEVDAHFDHARQRRNEGLMVKDPASVYQPGRRGLGWLKLKKALATLDCVVVGVEWGHGKRRGVLSDYTFAVRASDDPEAPLLTIGKAYTGLTDAEIAAMTEHFKQITLRDYGRYRTVVPEVVVEIAFDRIMRSDRHRSGYAMRFPRIVRIRDDKTPAEIDTMATVEAIFGEQASGRILLATGQRGETERIAATGEVESGAVGEGVDG